MTQFSFPKIIFIFGWELDAHAPELTDMKGRWNGFIVLPVRHDEGHSPHLKSYLSIVVIRALEWLNVNYTRDKENYNPQGMVQDILKLGMDFLWINKFQRQ